MAKTKILVVEDEAIVARDIQERLKSLGYDVPATAFSGELALAKAEEIHPDLVLMDIVLKGDMDGIAVAEVIKTRFDIPVIYLTAYADETTLERAKRTEPYGYIMKPFDNREVQSSITIALYKHDTEKKLRENEQWLSTILESIGDAVITTDRSGMITLINPVAEALTGWKRGDALDKNLDTVLYVDGEAPETTRTAIKKVFHEHEVASFINRTLVARNKREVPIDINFSPIKEKDDSIIGLVAAFRDVTERKKAEEAIKESEAKLDSIINNMRDIIFQLTPAGIIQYVSPNVKELYGYSPEEIVGEHFQKTTPASEVPRVFEVLKEVLEEKQIKNFEVIQLDKDGIAVPMDINITYVKKDGKIVAVQGVMRDISEYKRLLAELDETRIQQLQLKDQFLSHVSHELRTPLAVIQQFTTIMLDGLAGGLTLEQREYLDIMKRNSYQLKSIIDDLLEVTRSETGKLSVHPQCVALPEVIDDALKSVQIAASEKGIIITSDVEPGLSPVYADPDRLKQILTNLIDNAVKFTPQKGTVGVKACVSEEDPKYIHVKVQDTGYGIHPEEKSKIFEYLFQGESSYKSSRKGLGLGLYITKELVTRQGGKIWVESEPDKGSTFHFTLPVFLPYAMLAPILTAENLSQAEIALISIEMIPGEKRMLTKADDKVAGIVWEALGHTILPDMDVLLPRMAQTRWAESFFIVACANRKGAMALITRIQKQISLIKEIQSVGFVPKIAFTMVSISDDKKKISLEELVKYLIKEIEEIIKMVISKQKEELLWPEERFSS